MLEETSNLEVQLIQLINQIRGQHYSEQQTDSPLTIDKHIQDTIYGRDTPHLVTLPIRLARTQVASLQHELERIVQNHSTATTLVTANERQAQVWGRMGLGRRGCKKSGQCVSDVSPNSFASSPTIS